MAEGDSAKRSRPDADQVTNILREQGVANLRAKPELELVLDEMGIRDGSRRLGMRPHPISTPNQ